jgi:N-acetylmuramoyl-L-alanine amidase
MVLVVLQRGHVPRTSGATGAPGEQDFAIAAAARAATHLRALGHQVRIIDADVANEHYRGDFFVALHYDSSTNPNARGASVGYQSAEGQVFATVWKRHYEAAGWPRFRPDNYTPALAGYYGVRRAVAAGNRRAFIAEAGFHSNAQDAALLAEPAGPDRVGRAIAAAVAELAPAPPPIPPTHEVDDMRIVQSKDGETHGAAILVTGAAALLIINQAEFWAHIGAGIPHLAVSHAQFLHYAPLRVDD